MCIGICGKLIACEGEWGIVRYEGNQIRVRLGLAQVETGDLVMVHAGCVICRVSQSEADEITSLLQEFEEALSDE
ncbi:MAG: HypC/HybG/HupF family hydrogenase formation chaperone [Cellulosilyticaceae bacterium]